LWRGDKGRRSAAVSAGSAGIVPERFQLALLLSDSVLFIYFFFDSPAMANEARNAGIAI
jgi:hypothetical protein